MPKISVIIPVYNVEKYLEQCLDSVVNQTFKDIEIICVNDGSTDGSLRILQRYAANDSRIKIISKDNSGYGASMNLGLTNASGEYIGIVESDDFVELNMFEKLYFEAKAYDLDLVRCQYFQYTTKSNENFAVTNDWVPKGRIYSPLELNAPFYQAPAIWCNLFKKEMIEKNHIRFLETPGASYQDTSFAFKLYACSKRFKMISEPFLHYRVDNTNSSVNSRSKAFFVNVEYQEILNFSKTHNIYPKVKTLIPRLKYSCYVWNYNRLTRKLQQIFLLRWSIELLKDFFLGNIDHSLYSKKENKRIRTIAFCPILYLYRRSL